MRIGQSVCARTQISDLAYMGGSGLCGPMTIIFGSVIKTEYKSLTTKFGVNRAFHVIKLQFIDLTYMGGTGPYVLMTIIFSSVIWRLYTSITIKFGVNRAFHVLKTPVYRFDLYKR